MVKTGKLTKEKMMTETTMNQKIHNKRITSRKRTVSVPAPVPAPVQVPAQVPVPVTVIAAVIAAATAAATAIMITNRGIN